VDPTRLKIYSTFVERGFGYIGGNTCLVVEIISPLSDGYLHRFYLDFELDLDWVEMSEVVEIFLY
jgi:hypothetical protein